MDNLPVSIKNLTSQMQSVVNSESYSMDQGFSWLHRGVAEIFPQPHDADTETESLEKRLLNANRPLRVKLGILLVSLMSVVS